MADSIKKWDVHFRGTDKVLCVEGDESPDSAVAYGKGWMKLRDGGMINLEHVLAIVPHIDIDAPIPYLPTEPAPGTRPNLRDIDGDIWVPVEGTDTWEYADGRRHTRTKIEGVYGPVTEVWD
jgi:hypothetical protein